jgi:hypothetical protein
MHEVLASVLTTTTTSTTYHAHTHTKEREREKKKNILGNVLLINWITIV